MYLQFAGVHRESSVLFVSLLTVLSFAAHPRYGGAMCAYSILIPGVYLGDAAASESSVTAHYMTQTSLLISLANAVTDLNGAGNEMPRVRGLAARVWELNAKMDECLAWMNAHKSPAHTPAGNTVLRLQNVTVVPPSLRHDSSDHKGQFSDPKPLYYNVNVEIHPGTHTVIQGENGAGKTSLFRTLRGLWPPMQAENGQQLAIELPEGSYFMPQDSIFGVGTLKDEIVYPDIGAKLDDAAACALLEEVGLSVFVDKVRILPSCLCPLNPRDGTRLTFRSRCHGGATFLQRFSCWPFCG